MLSKNIVFIKNKELYTAIQCNDTVILSILFHEGFVSFSHSSFIESFSC